MLVLARKTGESIMIGDDIEVFIKIETDMHGAPIVRVGIEAPKQVRILRKEIYKKEQK